MRNDIWMQEKKQEVYTSMVTSLKLVAMTLPKDSGEAEVLAKMIKQLKGLITR